MEEKVSDEVELDVCATMLGLVERGQEEAKLARI